MHEVNVLRKESGFAITDRIKLWLPDEALIERYRDRLARGDARRLGRARRAANRKGMKRLVLLLAAAGLMAAGCGGSNAQPKDDPGAFAVKVVDQIVHNRYSTAWNDLHPADQKVAPSSEYVQCETRSPVLTAPTSTKVLSISSESVGIGDGTFVDSKAVHVRLGFAGGFHLVHTVHVVAAAREVDVDPAAGAVPRLQGGQVPGRRGVDPAAVDLVGSASESASRSEPDSGERRQPGSALRVGERELAAQLGRQAELDAFVDEPVRLDLGHAAQRGTSRRRARRASRAPRRRR